MRRTQRDTPIDAARAPEFLEVDPSNEPPEAVADEIDAATADVLPEVFTQGKRGLLDPGAGTVVERKDLLDATKTKVRSYRKKSRPIRQVAMDENDGPLIRLTRRAATRSFNPERKERRCRGNTNSLLRDRAPCGSFGHLIVLDHRVPPHSGWTFAVPSNAMAAQLRTALTVAEPSAQVSVPDSTTVG